MRKILCMILLVGILVISGCSSEKTCKSYCKNKGYSSGSCFSSCSGLPDLKFNNPPECSSNKFFSDIESFEICTSDREDDIAYGCLCE